MVQTGRVLTALTAGIVLTSSGAMAAVDPTLLNLAMPDAKVIAGINATNVRMSPLGQFVLAKMGAVVNNRQFAALGFNPVQDVSEILVASPGDRGNPAALIMARGTFPVDRLTAAVSAQPNPQVQTYGGATLLVDNPKAGAAVHAVAFIGNTIAVAGDLGSVKAAVDRQTHPEAIDTALALKVTQLSTAEDEWLVSTVPFASLIPANAAQNAQGPAAQVLPLLKNIQSFNGGVKFDQTIAVNGEAVTNDPKTATSLQAVIKLAVVLASSMNSQNDPHVAELLALLQTMQVNADGPSVDVALSIPESQVETLLNSIQTPAKAVTAPRELRNNRQN